MIIGLWRENKGSQTMIINCQFVGCKEEPKPRTTTINMADEIGIIYMCDKHWELWK